MSITEEIQKKVQEVKPKTSDIDEIIAQAASKASIAAALPVPMLDVAAVIYVQMSMVKKLAAIYNINIEDRGRLWLSSTISATVSKLTTEMVESLVEEIKLDKVLSSSLVKATISGFITTVTGEVYNYHFSKGGKPEDITPSDYLQFFKEQLESGRINIDTLADKLIDKSIEKFGLN